MTIEINEEIDPQDSSLIPPPETADADIETEQRTAQFRAAMYSFLAALFMRPVTEQLLQQISDESFLNELADLVSDGSIYDLRKYLCVLDKESLQVEIASLKQEYMSLFAVPTGRYVAPFEDIYRDISSDGQPQRGPLLGVRAIAARRIYREAGAKLENSCTELPNHIGVELAFMQYLCEREAASLMEEQEADSSSVNPAAFTQSEIYRGYQIRFLVEHLTRWFPQLNEEIQAKSDHVFYRCLSDLTQAYLEHDLGVLKQQILTSIQCSEFENQ